MLVLKQQLNFTLRNKSSKNPKMKTISTLQVEYSFILFESFCPLSCILEVFPLSAISFHIFCYLYVEFIYQNLPQFSKIWDSTKMDYWHSLQHTIFVAFTFPYLFIREIVIWNLSSEFLSVCSFRWKGKQSQTTAKEERASRSCKKKSQFFH